MSTAKTALFGTLLTQPCRPVVLVVVGHADKQTNKANPSTNHKSQKAKQTSTRPEEEEEEGQKSVK